MNLEGLTLHILTNKLKEELLGGKIYKVFMPSYESLLLLVKRERDTAALLADFSCGSPMLYLPNNLPERPESPPAFCMLLRKHLEEGRITRIEQSGLDRIITIDIDTIGTARQIVTKQLIFELTGKNSNIIFAENGLIFDSLKHVNKAMSSFRQIMPNLPYLAPPQQTGLSILTAPANAIIEAMHEFKTKNSLAALIAATTGIGKITASELLAAAGIDSNTTALTAEEEQRLANAIYSLQQSANQQTSAPVYAVISRTNQVKTILPFAPTILEPGCNTKQLPDINSALNYAVTLTPIQLPEQETLQKLVIGESQRLEKKLLEFLALRKYTPEQRIRIVEQAIYNTPDIGLVIIDGIRDMVYDINSPGESTRIISKLMQWTDDRQIHIHTILHQNKGDENARGHIGTELNNKAETVLLVEKDKSNGDISNVSAMHIRAMDFEPFAFRINDNALPELIEGYRPEAKKPGRPEEEKFDPYRHITEQQHRIALEAAFGLKEEYGYKDLETALIKSYMSVGVKLNHQKAVSLITMLRNKRMIVQENGRKYTFKPDFHY